MSVRQVSPYTPIQANSQTMNLDPSLKSAHIYCRVCEQELKITRENLRSFWLNHSLCDEHATRFQKIIKDPSPLCDKIKKICTDKGLLLKELNHLSGYTNRVGFLSSWKKGTAPELDTLECLAHGLGITLASLLDQQETVDTVAKRALFCQVCNHEGLKYKGIAFCDQHKAEYLKHSENGCKYFGNKIKQLIHDLGLTQKDAAAWCGTNREAIARFIGGGRQPAPEKLCILAAGFEKPLSYFFDIDESNTLTLTPENERYSSNTSAASTITTLIPLQQPTTHVTNNSGSPYTLAPFMELKSRQPPITPHLPMSTSTAYNLYPMHQPTMHATYVSGLPCTFASPMEFGSCEQTPSHLPMNDQNNYSPYGQSIAEYVALTEVEQTGIWDDYSMQLTDDDSSDFVPTNELNVSHDEELFSDQEVSTLFDTLPMLEDLG